MLTYLIILLHFQDYLCLQDIHESKTSLSDLDQEELLTSLTA